MRLKRHLVLMAALVCLVILVGMGVVLYAFYQVSRRTAPSTPNYQAAELYSQAVAQIDKGQYQIAEQYLQQALQKQDDSTYRNQLAVVEYRLKKYPEAIAEYQKLIDQNQDPAFAYNGIGNADRDWGTDHRTDAEAAYRKAISTDPNYAAAYSNLAQLLAAEGKQADAMAVLDQGIAATHQKELQQIKDALTAK